MKHYHDRKSAKKLRNFHTGEKVKTRDYRGGDHRKKKMINGVIVDKLGPVRYLIDVGYTIYNRHVDQIEKIGQKVNLELEDSELDLIDNDEPQGECMPIVRSPTVVPRVEPPRRSSRVKKPNKLYNNDNFVLRK